MGRSKAESVSTGGSEDRASADSAAVRTGFGIAAFGGSHRRLTLLS
jgi:hypothetical protein